MAVSKSSSSRSSGPRAGADAEGTPHRETAPSPEQPAAEAGGSHTHRAPNEYEGLSASPSPISVMDDQQLATMTHMLGVLGCVPSMLIHRWSRSRARFTAQESLEAANFTLLPTLVVLAGLVLSFIPYVGWIFAILAAAAWLLLAVSSVIAAISANSGRPHRYHLNWYLYDALSHRREERRRERQTSGPVTAQGQIVTPSGRTDDAPAVD